MSPICSALILCAKTGTANSISHALQRHGMDAVTAVSVEEALEKLKRSPADVVIAESRLSDGRSSLPFLADVRRLLPLAMRMIYETAPISADLRSLVNDVAPVAIFAGSVDPERVWKILALEGPVTRAPGPASADYTLDPERIRQRNRELEEENRLLQGELQRLKRSQKSPLPSSGEGAARTQAPAPVLAAGDLADGIAATLGEMMEDRDVALPVLPAVALHVQKVLASENCSFETVAEMVGMEQGMSARLLQVANSPVYAGLERIRNLQQAVARLGLRETRNILQAVIAENLFRASTQSMANLMATLWVHSLCCAYSNENIAQTLQIPESDDYFMMGLLHDVGKLAILHLLAAGLRQSLWDKALVTEETMKAIMRRRHNEFGARLMEKWQYPAIFCEVVLRHDDGSDLRAQAEPVLVTYYSNLLTRKLGYSLVSWEEEPLDDHDLAEALNMSEGKRLRLENSLGQIVEKVRRTFLSRK